ncbi:MAG: metal-sensing transcriptional repressor [Schwartzia sp.]|nr:metal-sensing transcriptional repressor [Schwartzia sp. (in: firmicutes)]MBR1885240.1 metal-sensing transcriptional repressor [Schwartzia sp. (in: firmicutes)]
MNVKARKTQATEPAGEAHTHAHTHTHPHTQTRAVLNRMARLIGHLQSVRRMVEEGRDCSEVLLQISAVDAALKNVGKMILKDHLEHCIVDAVQDNDREALERLGQAIDRFVQ